MFDAPTAFDRRRIVPALTSGDFILSRKPFAASVKAVLAAATGQNGWNRVLPPMSEIPMPERDWLLHDFMHWEAGLPPAWRSLGRPDAHSPAKELHRSPLRLASRG
jgi:4-hydroxy-tetrahydrodipicolinate synthase